MYRLMQTQSIAECSKGSILQLTCIMLPFVIKIFVLSISELPLKTYFTVLLLLCTCYLRHDTWICTEHVMQWAHTI